MYKNSQWCCERMKFFSINCLCIFLNIVTATTPSYVPPPIDLMSTGEQHKCETSFIHLAYREVLVSFPYCIKKFELDPQQNVSNQTCEGTIQCLADIIKDNFNYDVADSFDYGTMLDASAAHAEWAAKLGVENVTEIAMNTLLAFYVKCHQMSGDDHTLYSFANWLTKWIFGLACNFDPKILPTPKSLKHLEGNQTIGEYWLLYYHSDMTMAIMYAAANNDPNSLWQVPLYELRGKNSNNAMALAYGNGKIDEAIDLSWPKMFKTNDFVQDLLKREVQFTIRHLLHLLLMHDVDSNDPFPVWHTVLTSEIDKLVQKKTQGSLKLESYSNGMKNKFDTDMEKAMEALELWGEQVETDLEKLDSGDDDYGDSSRKKVEL